MAREAEELAEQADRIKKLRALSRKSGEDVAGEIGVSYRTYQRWEGAEGEISTDNLKKLAAYFGTTPDYIEYGVVERGTTPNPFPSSSPDLAQQLAEIKELLVQAKEERAKARADAAARAAAALRRIDALEATIQDRLPRQRPA